MLDALASDPDVLHADGDPTASFLDDFAGLETPPALGANGTHELLLDPPASADFLLYVAAPTGTSVTLDVDGVTAIPTTPTDADGELRSVTSFALTAGDLVPVTLTLAGLPAGQAAELRWRTNALAKAAIPASRVYDAGAYEQAERTLRRVQKTVLAAKALGLTAGEVADLGAVRTVTRRAVERARRRRHDRGRRRRGAVGAARMGAVVRPAEEGARAGRRHVPRHPARPGRGRRAGQARGGRRHGVGRGGPHRGAHGVRSHGRRSRRPGEPCAG